MREDAHPGSWAKWRGKDESGTGDLRGQGEPRVSCDIQSRNRQDMGPFTAALAGMGQLALDLGTPETRRYAEDTCESGVYKLGVCKSVVECNNND